MPLVGDNSATTAVEMTRPHLWMSSPATLATSRTSALSTLSLLLKMVLPPGSVQHRTERKSEHVQKRRKEVRRLRRTAGPLRSCPFVGGLSFQPFHPPPCCVFSCGCFGKSRFRMGVAMDLLGEHPRWQSVTDFSTKALWHSVIATSSLNPRQSISCGPTASSAPNCVNFQHPTAPSVQTSWRHDLIELFCRIPQKLSKFNPCKEADVCKQSLGCFVSAGLPAHGKMQWVCSSERERLSEVSC